MNLTSSVLRARARARTHTNHIKIIKSNMQTLNPLCIESFTLNIKSLHKKSLISSDRQSLNRCTEAYGDMRSITALLRTEAVSYTHLDVYKRQAYHRMLLYNGSMIDGHY